MRSLIGYRKPVELIVLIDLIAFTLLFLYKEPYDWYVLLAGLLVIGLICGSYYVIIKKSLGDEYLYPIAAMLASLGFIMIYRLNPLQGFKQIIWFAAGILLFFLSYYIFSRISLWDKLMIYYILAAVTLFLFTFVFGQSINGSKNWIEVAGFTFQPSELIKILFVLSLACYLSRSKQLITNRVMLPIHQSRFIYRLGLMFIAYGHIGFLVLQREWGTSLLFFLIYIMIVHAFDKSFSFFALNMGTAAFGAVGGYLFLYHIQVRVETWLDPWKDIAGKGYQITQSLFAIGEGGFFGTGLGMGRPDLIPAVNTDFIFSAICEEMGIFGGVAIILLYFILAYRGFKITLMVKNIFYKIIALGITLMFGFQTFIIIGGVIKLIPLTGITLPFVSYGGSSLTTSFIALGILQAISAKHDIVAGGESNEE